MKKTVPILLLVALFAGAGWYFFTQEADSVHELPPPSLAPVVPVKTESPEPQVAEVELLPEPIAPPVPLPLLNESDAELKQALSQIKGADSLFQYLVKTELISRLVATIDSLGSRQVPSQINPVRPVGGKLVADLNGDSMILGVENFDRYTGHVAMMKGLDAGALVAIYRRYGILFEQAWQENGGEGSFDERLQVVIDQLLQTPVVKGAINLNKPEAVYLFDEPALEALSAGQKILLRMGSENTAVVKEKLIEIKVALNPTLEA